MKNDKTPLTDDQLDFFRKELKKRKRKIKGQVERLRDEELPAQFKGEQSNESYGDDAKSDQIAQRTTSLIRHYYQRLQQIDKALVRIENKTYGIDQRTGKAIRLERLKAQPAALKAMESA